MEQWVSNLCADAGGEFCPCYLALIGRCVNCALLCNQPDCNCQWTGSCIYSDFVWNGKQNKAPRLTVPITIVERTKVGPDLYVFSLKLPVWMTKELHVPGSFVFLRPEDVPPYFESPLSIMHVDKDFTTHIAVQVVGPKTWALLRAEKLLCRGVFESGMLGLSNLKRKSEKTLIVAKGVSQGRGVHTADYLAARGTQVTIALGPGNAGSLFAAKWLTPGRDRLVELPKRSDRNRDDIAALIEFGGFDLIVSAGPDVQHQMVYEVAEQTAPGVRMAFTNNALMCCGEGICGACGSHTGDSTAAAAAKRACKALPDTEVLAFLKK